MISHDMSDLIVRGARASDGSPSDVAVVGGRVAEPGSATGTSYDAAGLTVLPGLIDLQVNGVAGIDLTLEPERLWEAAAALPAYGVTAFLPTVITSAPDARDRALATFVDGPPAGWAGALPLGLHFEGPMLAPARKGAHPERWLRPPSTELVADWSRATGVTMVTIAPELPGALEVISALVARDVIVAIGHTEATAAEVTAAAGRGARAVTHLGNAMPALAAREPGAFGAALADPRLVAGVIADGHHLDPVTLSVLWRVLGRERLVAVTDCTAALGMPDGPARLGDQRVVVRDGTVRLADGTLAGSAASLPQCLRVLREATGCSLEEAVATCTTTAARLVGDHERGRLTPGARGDLTLVDDDLHVVATVVGGRLVHGGQA
ncbi:N-acetylglucosamine-6-phosphate deacetylase [Nocardioides bizhenqiangii]|uniref:N-acetylglucosamine-6-phosphate deacetylase n=1 Tax=Nocardioides bizhenqiangii TaxID=3095076 RepID=A0ABZ0ZT76_9ACTN|nr:N-acetylglucosamine-6-phosphate deacetylase [Nocardioides sp. HM61]WQQ27474.1 N-acetylglucosamine-6-phosphate deacetylase [Nocardioides sp. HM61]